MSIDPNNPPILTPSLSTFTDLSQDLSKTSIKQEPADIFQCPPDSLARSYSGFKDEQLGQNAKLQEIARAMGTVENGDLSDQEETLSNQAFVNYNRKEKSLGELSKKFLTMFGKTEECVISLDTVTNQLGVERRRIYDIINILESLGVIFRKGKNHYQWKGLNSIHKTIEKLQRENQVKNEEKNPQRNEQSDESESFWDMKPVFRKEKYLSFLSTGFIKLFISWKNIISLEQAAKKLASTSVEDNKIKTKIRRLYDIANVFSVLGIIKKTCLESKKPAFQWIGLPGLDSFIRKLYTSHDENKTLSAKQKRKVDEESLLLSTRKESPPTRIGAQFHEEETRIPQEIPLRQNMLEDFLVMLLNLCKKELHEQNVPSAQEIFPDITKTLQFDNSENLKPRNMASKLEELKFDIQNNSLMRMELEKILMNEKKWQHEFMPMTLQDKTNAQNNLSGFKRPASTTLGEFEVKISKKIPPLQLEEEFDKGEKTVKGQSKENYPLQQQEVKVEPSGE